MKTQNKQIVIAVAGNPNCGKSTLINALAGSRLHVGNWPGVTVEKKEAELEYEGLTIRFIDLPGIYSLSPFSQDEIIARDFLLEEKPDLILNVLDATNLERNLNLTVQLLTLQIPTILALNVYDELRKKQASIDIPLMEEQLGVAVIPTVAPRGEGIVPLLRKIKEYALNPSPATPRTLHFNQDVEDALDQIMRHVDSQHTESAIELPRRWLALRLLEQDPYLQEKYGLALEKTIHQSITQHLRTQHSRRLDEILADARFALVKGLIESVLSRPRISKIDLTDKIDKFVLNKWIGIPLFVFAMWLIFKLTFDVATPYVDWLDGLVSGPLSRWITNLLLAVRAPVWLISLVVDGIIAGVGAVLVFTPVIFFMMFFITFLEGSGYMARVAFIMDRVMHVMGLHGRSFIPMILGFGCNVPSIYATRTLETDQEKQLTSLLVPLMSCGARLPVYVLFAGAFFTSHKGTVIWSLYFLGVVMAFLMGALFKRSLFRGTAREFIMELPPYRLPSLSNVMVHTWEKVKHFVIKAGTYIMAMSVIVWFLFFLPIGSDKEHSFLGRAGKVISPVLKPLGFGTWQAGSSIISGIVAKEVVVSTMGTIYVGEEETQPFYTNIIVRGIQKKIPLLRDEPSFWQDVGELGKGLLTATRDAAVSLFTIGFVSMSAEEDLANESLKQALKGDFTPLSAYAFLVFVLLYMPCMVVLAAMKGELKTWKWAGISVAYQMLLAWVMAFIVYQGGRLLGLG